MGCPVQKFPYVCLFSSHLSIEKLFLTWNSMLGKVFSVHMCFMLLGQTEDACWPFQNKCIKSFHQSHTCNGTNKLMWFSYNQTACSPFPLIV